MYSRHRPTTLRSPAQGFWPVENLNAMKQATDLIVETNSPEALDVILQTFGAVVVQSDINKPTYMQKDGGYVVRCFGNPDFIKFAITNQGYGKVLKTLPELV